MATYTVDTLPSKLKSGDIINCDYSGAAKNITLPKGIYQLECWGAQGGTYSSYTGGLGGYAIGTITFNTDTLIYLYAGGQPASTTSTSSVSGGFNGGGSSHTFSYSGTTSYGQPGGGGTDIRIGQDSLYARVIVAGGGGGSCSAAAATTKYGGGLSGASPQSGYGASQTAAGTNGSFGIGGNATSSGSNYKYGSGGGGGGWYGGGACSSYSDSTNYRGYNGGGSGYVYTSSTASNYPSGCLLNSDYYLTDAETIAGNTSFPSTSVGTETGHSGNGYIRITVIKAGGGVNLRSKIDGHWKDSEAVYVKVNDVWKEVTSILIKSGADKTPHIYGATWDGTSTTSWTRTDDAADFADPNPYVSGATSYGSPFDNLMPWSGMAISERTGGTMVSIPKFWYKLTQNGSGMSIQIADAQVDGYSVSPAHMDRGDGNGQSDTVYIGRYHCASDYTSKTGVAPKANITRSTARTGIHNLGSNIWQMDFAVRFTIWLLYIVEFADWNSQAKIGYGCGNNSSAQNMGTSDSMPYHTGTRQTSRTTYGVGTQYRYIEGLWDNVYDWMDGCYYNSNGLNLIMNPSKFSDSSNGTLAGKPSNGYPSAFAVASNGGFPMFYPTAANGSDSTYSCDYWGFDGSYPCLYVGGSYNQGLDRGLFYVSCHSASSSVGYFGCRLMQLNGEPVTSPSTSPWKQLA